MYPSISRGWTPHAIFLIDRNDPLWECWSVTCQILPIRGYTRYQELLYRNGSFKEMITAFPAAPLPSFLPFYFRVHAFSIIIIIIIIIIVIVIVIVIVIIIIIIIIIIIA